MISHPPDDQGRGIKEALELDPRVKVVPTSAVKGQGLDELVAFFTASPDRPPHA